MKLTPAEAGKLGITDDTPAPTKYRNQRVTVDGRTFASKAEADYYQTLRLRERTGQITELRCQPRYDIIIRGVRVCTYVADFDYRIVATNQIEVVDVKSEFTRTLPVYRLKKKLMWAVHQIRVKEVLG